MGGENTNANKVYSDMAARTVGGKTINQICLITGSNKGLCSGRLLSASEQ